MVHFHEKPNFRSIFECHFSYWISFSDSNLTLLISHCLRHITPLTPRIRWVFIVVIHAEEPNAIRNHHHQHQHQHQTTNCLCKQLFTGEQEGQGRWGEIADMMTMTEMGKQRQQGGGGGGGGDNGVDAPRTIARSCFVSGQDFFSF